MTSSAAAASSSTTATSVTCISRPSASVRAAQVDDAGDAGTADGHVGDPPPPGAPEGVGDDHGHVDRRLAPQAVADAAGRAVAVDGQQRRVAPLHVRQVDAGVGAHEAVDRLADDELAPSAQHPHRLPLDQRLVRQGIVGIDRHQPVLGLRHDLLGDHDDVAVDEGRALGDGGLGDERGQVGAHADLGQALDAEDLESCRHRPGSPTAAPASSTTRARAAASVGPVMIVGATTARTPSASTASARSRVGLVDDEGADPRRVEPGDADDRRLVAELGQEPVGRALQGGPGDDGGDGHDRRPPGGDRLGDAGHRQHRADRDDGVRRRHHDHVGVGDGGRAPRGRAGPRRRPRTARPTPAPRGGARRSTPGTRPRSHPRRAA